MKLPAKLALLLLSVLGAMPLSAQTIQFWNRGSGTWDTTTTPYWFATTAATTATTIWTNGNSATIGNNANASGTVTIQPGGVTVANLANGGSSAVMNHVLTGGGITLAGPASVWTIGAAANSKLTVESVIDGASSLEKTGTRLLILAGDNTYTGGTTISAGTLQLGNGGTTGSVAGNIAITVAASGGLVFNRSDTFTFGGVISSTAAGTVTQAGAGTLILTGANTYTGTTTVSAGTLQLGNGGTTGSVAGNIVANSPLVFNRSDTLVNAGNISGTSSFAQAGSGTLILTGSASAAGGATVSTGTLQIGNGGATGSVTGNIANAAALVFNRNNTYTYAGVISGAGSLTQAGTGSLILTGASTYAGATTVSAGLLQVDGSLASALTNVNSGGTLGGSGSIAGDVNINSGGTLRPGASPGLFTTGGHLALASGASTFLELNGPDRGLTYDALDVGSLFTAGGSLSLDLGFLPSSQSFLLASYASLGLGDFSSVFITGSSVGSLSSLGGGQWSAVIGDSTFALSLGGTQMTLAVSPASAVPEPATYALCVGAAALLGAALRRQRIRAAQT
jgi:fibronectin-binding autotransporter adhesin